MQIIKNKTNIDFIGKRKLAVYLSTVLNLAVIAGLAIFGLNFGVDFAGGTVVELKFNRPIDSAEVRRRALDGGLHDPTVQAIGPAEEASYLLRLGGTTQLTKESAAKAEQAIRALAEVKNFHVDTDSGLITFRADKDIDREQVRRAVADAGTSVSEIRRTNAQNGGFDYQVVASGMADKIREAMAKGQTTPDFQVQRVDYVGPQVGKVLRNKGVMALVYAMLMILVYVAFRFDFKFGPGALVAMLHDVVMVTGYYLVSRREFNLTSIAVLLTIIGYSVNDTIVIYDRIREEMARFKGKPLAEIINIAINETLSRTILTAGVTALSLVGLLIFGVGEIWDFAMAMLIGIVVGVYSTIFVASPMTLWLDERQARGPRGKGAPVATGMSPNAA